MFLMDKKKLSLTYRPVTEPADLTELKAFLALNALPFEDILLQGNLFAIYRSSTGEVTGTGGLEFYGDYALLRSVAVAKGSRKHGHGEAIVMDLVGRARARNVGGIYLLTETAQAFFERLNFKTLSREQAPLEIKSSSEFSSVCPVSAVLMAIPGGSRSNTSPENQPGVL
jgi:amino-acid N-acetyltransferase